jgi:transcriptional regulator with XRE-family HTH domain
MLLLWRAMDSTPLFRFLESNGIGVVQLAEVSGISRQHINRLKSGRMEPTRSVMLWITEAACYIVRRRLEVGELFDLRVEINEELLGEPGSDGEAAEIEEPCSPPAAVGGVRL